jgi:hypothetical protein
MNWTKSIANGSGFGFLDLDSRIFMRTPDLHRIRTTRYGSPPLDPIEPQTIFMCEGYNLRHLLTRNTTSWIFLDNGISRESVSHKHHHFYDTPLKVYSMDDLSIQPGPCFWERHQNAFWMPVVDKCQQTRSVGFVRFIEKSYEIRDWKDDIQIRHIDIFTRLTVRFTQKLFGQIHSEDI